MLTSLLRALPLLLYLILVCSLQSVRIVNFSRRLRPYLHLSLIESQTNRGSVSLRCPFLLGSPDPPQKNLHFSWSQLFLIFFGADPQGRVHPLLILFHGLATPLLQFLTLQMVLLEIPILLAPFATLVQNTNFGRVTQVHLPVPVGHLPHLLPVEQ